MVTTILLSRGLSGWLRPETSSNTFECSDAPLDIVVLTMNRGDSFKRLLDSLSNSDYGCAPIDLMIYIDAQNYPISRNEIEDEDKVVEIALSYKWTHGKKKIHRRLRNAGLRIAWLESMHLHKSEEEGYIAFFEDDMEVSSQWYTFFQLVQKSGVFDTNNNITSLCLHPLVPSGTSIDMQCSKRKIEKESLVLDTNQFTCSWGPIWKRSHWKHLMEGSHNLDRQNKLPYVPLNVKDGKTINSYLRRGFDIQSAYVKRFLAENSFITLTYSLTTCFPENKDITKTFFAINHKEAGVNYGRKKNLNTEESLLVDAEKMEEIVDHLLITNKSQNHKNDTKIDPPHIFKPQMFEKSDFEAASKLCLPNIIEELKYQKPIEGNWFVPTDFRSSLSNRHSFVSVPCSASVEDGNCTYHSNDAYSVAKYLNHNNGFYLEVGGFDGLDNSQTRFVESLGWSGVVIEADPDNYIKLVKNRPSAMTVNAIICKDEETDFHFVRNEDFPQVNGIWEHMTIGFRETWYPNLNIS